MVTSVHDDPKIAPPHYSKVQIRGPACNSDFDSDSDAGSPCWRPTPKRCLRRRPEDILSSAKSVCLCEAKKETKGVAEPSTSPFKRCWTMMHELVAAQRLLNTSEAWFITWSPTPVQRTCWISAESICLCEDKKETKGVAEPSKSPLERCWSMHELVAAQRLLKPLRSFGLSPCRRDQNANCITVQSKRENEATRSKLS